MGADVQFLAAVVIDGREHLDRAQRGIGAPRTLAWKSRLARTWERRQQHRRRRPRFDGSRGGLILADAGWKNALDRHRLHRQRGDHAGAASVIGEHQRGACRRCRRAVRRTHRRPPLGGSTAASRDRFCAANHRGRYINRRAPNSGADIEKYFRAQGADVVSSVGRRTGRSEARSRRPDSWCRSLRASARSRAGSGPGQRAWLATPALRPSEQCGDDQFFPDRARCATMEAMTGPASSDEPPDGQPSGRTPEQQAWADHSAALWQRAHDLARRHPEHDPSDLYHALRCLELTPKERLRAGLQRGRLRAYAR